MTDNTTPQTALPTVYDPTSVESKWYKFWLDKDYFHAEVNDPRPKYSITIPPPNVTGSLHIGHALCYTIQDVLTRWKRMQGFKTLCLPGTDHAGIATQNKVEQQLAEEGLTRHDLGREEFLKRVWAWKEKYGGQILHQFKTMGFSFDWERERFTMDDGLLGRGAGVVRPPVRQGLHLPRRARHQLVPALPHGDLRHRGRARRAAQPSVVSSRYPLEDGSGYVVVATTRPETMLGDTAVAVNPERRALQGHGRQEASKLPLTDRVIPIIADEFVDHGVRHRRGEGHARRTTRTTSRSACGTTCRR